MKLYNTMTRQTEEITPLQDHKIGFYSCGPTVYDYPHIGNWYSFIRWDLVARTLRAQGYDLTWVMNITDVGHLVSDMDEGEDKLEKGARREGKTAWEIATFYTDYFTDGLSRLNISKPDVLPKATDHIQEQIDLIKTLETKGFTYKIDDGIYFDTSKLDDYGKLARLDIDAQQAGARVEPNQQKRNSADFALWKFSPKDKHRDMEWQSPWGIGFPGWHIECSAMSMKYLGKTIDIHAGGIDHIPVHHTNEIAQSESATGKTFANIWIHSNFILIDGKKMSKSLDNFYTLEDIEKKGIDLLAFKLFVIQAHYRTESNFTWDSLTATANRLNNLRAFADLTWQDTGRAGDSEVSDYIQQFIDAMQNDIDTPKALEVISTLSNQFDNKKPNKTEAQELSKFFIIVDQYLGLDLSERSDISDPQKALIKDREKARDDQNWLTSDEIRDQLLSQGIHVNDTPAGTIWHR